MLPLFFFACRLQPPAESCGTTEPFGDYSISSMSLDDPSLSAAVDLSLVIPRDVRYTPEGAAIAVIAHGGVEPDGAPATPGNLVVRAPGVAQLYVGLPGGENDEGIDDMRGPEGRGAIAAALRYAADWVADTEGCTLSQRIPLAPVAPILVGHSNGGNLAWTTLADSALDMPEPAGVVTFEMPPSGQFVLIEPGGPERDSPLYAEGSCTLGADNRIRCDFDYGQLFFFEQPKQEAGGELYVDDGDGKLEPNQDYRLSRIFAPSEGLWFHSVEARSVADSQGVTLVNRADLGATDAFWAAREGPPAMPAVKRRFNPPAIAVATEDDHMLLGATDHAQVYKTMEAMEKARLSWFRLNPDNSILRRVAGVDAPENNALVYRGASLLPEVDDVAALDELYVTAAVVELLDRTLYDNWDVDLE